MQEDIKAMARESEKDPAAIGQALALIIRMAQHMVDELGLTERDLTAFDDHLRQWDSSGWVWDPTAWRNRDEAEQKEAEQRLRVVRLLMGLPVRGELPGAILTAGFNTDGKLVGYYVARVPEGETP